MAFMSMIFVGIFLVLCVVWLVGLILIIAGLCIRAGYKKKVKLQANGEWENTVVKKPKSPIVLTILGILCMTPVTLLVVMVTIGSFSANVKNEGILRIQVEDGTVEDVERLLKEGVSPNCSRDESDANVVAEDGEYTVLHYLSSANHISDSAEKIQLLIDYGADVDRRTYWCDYTPEEHMGSEYNLDRGYNDGCGETPLMQACQAGNYEGVKVLIENGADVNAKDYCGKTALVYAVHFGNKSDGEEVQMKIVKLLLDNGADRNMSSRYSGTALEEARERDLQRIEQILLEY